MFATLAEDVKSFFNTKGIYEIQLTEEQKEGLSITNGVILQKKQVEVETDIGKRNTNSVVRTSLLCSCGTFIPDSKFNEECPICFKKMKRRVSLPKTNELIFKGKEFALYKGDKDKSEIIKTISSPTYRIVQLNNKYMLEQMKSKDAYTVIPIARDGKHTRDRDLFNHFIDFTKKDFICFLEAFNETVDSKYRININLKTTHYNIIYRTFILSMYDEKFLMLNQLFNYTFPNSWIQEDTRNKNHVSTRSAIREIENRFFIMNLFNDLFTPNPSIFNVSGRKITQFFQLPKKIIKLLREQNETDIASNVIEVQVLYELTDKSPEVTADILNILLDNQVSMVLLRQINRKLLILIRNKHELKDIIYYLKNIQEKQNLSFTDGLQYYVDYVSMSVSMNVSYEKYHHNIILAHDICAKDYKVLEDEKTKVIFETVYNDMNPDYSHIDSDYIYVRPTSVESVVKEGRALRHCISSYTPKIMKNESLIYFMRYAHQPDESFVTIEIDPQEKAIIQARGKFNRKLTTHEKTHLKAWAKEVEIEVHI